MSTRTEPLAAHGNPMALLHQTHRSIKRGQYMEHSRRVRLPPHAVCRPDRARHREGCRENLCRLVHRREELLHSPVRRGQAVLYKNRARHVPHRSQPNPDGFIRKAAQGQIPLLISNGTTDSGGRRSSGGSGKDRSGRVRKPCAKRSCAAKSGLPKRAEYWHGLSLYLHWFAELLQEHISKYITRAL